MKGDEYKAEHYALFERVLCEFPGGFIAGGAVRDAELGLPIKDIDVWVPLKAYDEQLRDAGAGEYLGDDSPVRAVVVDDRDWCPYPIHLMLTDDEALADPWLILQRFDYGLCRIAYTKDGLYLTMDFVNDERAHRLTLVNAKFTSPARYERLRTKFPGWEIDAPDAA